MNEKIQKMRLEDIMGERFGRYSKYIIQERALPDVRDGLKPVQRRILYTMYQDGNTAKNAYRKSAKTVGNVMGNLHPHGDSSIYEAMVRMSQDFKYKETLIDMHGNNGSIDGDPAASMRYTEARLSPLASELLKDIDKGLVEHVPNFDDTTKEPTVLPSFYPNLLVNGATGISAGYATDIPPHNLREVINGVIFAMKNPDYTLGQLMRHIKGPDFPTGGLLFDPEEIKKAYETGKGRLVIRSKTDIEKLNGGRQAIVVSEIPYEVNKAKLVEKMGEILLDKKVPGISEVRDETDRNELRIVIELRKDANADVVLKYLLKNTDLQISYSLNMVAIYNKRPVLMSLPMLINAYIMHQKEVVTNRTNFDLNAAKKRQHIVEGLIKMVSVIDEVVEIIRKSEDKADSKQNLMKAFNFSEAQVEAIVTLQLYRLSNTDITALEAEMEALNERIQLLTEILGSESRLIDVIETELKDIAKKFGTPRRTEVSKGESDIKLDEVDLIEKEEVMISITRDGYVKRTSLRSYVASKVDAPEMKEDDVFIGKVQTNTLNRILLFTQTGQYMLLPIHRLPEIRWKDMGDHLSTLVNLESTDKIVSFLVVDDFAKPLDIFTVSKLGMVKRTTLADFEVTRFTRKMMAMNLAEGDEVVGVCMLEHVHNTMTVVVATHKGMVLAYDNNEVPVAGVRAKGVKAINLNKDDYIAGACLAYAHDEVHLHLDNDKVKKIKKGALEISKRARKGTQILPSTRRTVKVSVPQPDFNEVDEDETGQMSLL